MTIVFQRSKYQFKKTVGEFSFCMDNVFMRQSIASKPDLDWSQIKETIKLLAISVVQVENGMRLGDNSVNVLTDNFAGMVNELQTIHAIIKELPISDERDKALVHCLAAQDKIQSSIVAFQFYDRLQQCLYHTSLSLQGLSELIDDQDRLYNPKQWLIFQRKIRSYYTMESEKVMFDAVLQGKSINEALALAAAQDGLAGGNDIELF